MEKYLHSLPLKRTKLLSEGTPNGNTSLLADLKDEAGVPSLETALAEIAKLERICSLGLPPDLFAGVSRKRLLWCKRRISVEDLSEIREHPPQVRYSLLGVITTLLSPAAT